MNTEDIVLLGIKDSVLALSKKTGDILWATVLPGSLGQQFVGVLRMVRGYSRMPEGSCIAWR